MAFVAIAVWYGWKVDSLALLAGAAHNLRDVAGLVLAWAATIAARATPDHRHTYGWRRASIMAAFSIAVLLLVASGSLAREAIIRLHTPAANDVTAALFLSGRSGDLNIRVAFLHMAADAAVSLGVVIAGLLYLWTAWQRLDPAFSLAIALVIVMGTWGLFKQSLHLLFDSGPESVDLHAVRDYLLSQPGVEDSHDLHVWVTSTTDIALTAHLMMPGGHPGYEFFMRLKPRCATGTRSLTRRYRSISAGSIIGVR